MLRELTRVQILDERIATARIATEHRATHILTIRGEMPYHSIHECYGMVSGTLQQVLRSVHIDKADPVGLYETLLQLSGVCFVSLVSLVRPATRLELDNRFASVSDQVEFSFEKTLNKHGRGSFSSRHEILGVLAEEHLELADAIRTGSEVSIGSELMDLLIPSTFGIACMASKTLEW